MTMLWVDNTSYFGPDRRCERTMRMLERRRENYAGPAPSLSMAMRQLRMRVLDAQGAQAAPFAERLRGVAQLARMQNEPGVANALGQLATGLANARGADVRQKLYAGLDRAHTLMRA
jgi:hypothetical protein